MAVTLPHPSLGIIIPAVLIGSIGYGCQFFVFWHYFSRARTQFFQGCLTMVWVSYVVAIFKDPGSTPRDYTPKSGDWRRWCKKCRSYKPERAHHCKTCKKCVLKMDHHCPWTCNCVGYLNMPHFMRFLFWVDFTTAFVLVELVKRASTFWDQRHAPSTTFARHELWATPILLAADGFVLLTVGLLTVKCLVHIVSGMSQIETWEWERIESQIRSERFWDRIRANFSSFHGRTMPRLQSIRSRSAYYRYDAAKAEKSDHYLFSIDDIVFPYDYGFWENLVDQLNYPWLWLVPWAGPLGNGVDFAKSELVEEDQLGLPWPPDGGNQLDTVAQELEITESTPVRQIIEYRRNLPRGRWENDMGEKIGDYGVDLDSEEYRAKRD